MTAEEVINPGEDVMGSDGEKLGTVAYVVVNPNDMHITDIVVSTGAILGRDVVVPTHDVDRVAEGSVYLTLDKEGLRACKDYVDVEYRQPPTDWAPAAGMAYPAGAMLWPTSTYYPQAASVTVNAPKGTVGLSQGMEVVSSDGHKVGSIDALVVDPESGDVTEIVIKEGFIFTHDTGIPATRIATIEPDRVVLNLTEDQVKAEFEQQQ
jgi:sporulation protein YlmC with PRC-barrel domain